MAKQDTSHLRDTWVEKAPAILVVIDGVQHLVRPKPVADGKSCGYFLNAKQTITVDGQPVDVQIGLNISAIGSKG
jgi:hypothetical protein